MVEIPIGVRLREYRYEYLRQNRNTQGHHTVRNMVHPLDLLFRLDVQKGVTLVV